MIWQSARCQAGEGQCSWQGHHLTVHPMNALETRAGQLAPLHKMPERGVQQAESHPLSPSQAVPWGLRCPEGVLFLIHTNVP